MVYFVRNRDGTGPIKIGSTVQMAERIKQLDYHTKSRLEILGIIDGDEPEEKELHRRFAHLRIRPSISSEWFAAGDDLLDFISGECRPWNPSDDKPNTSATLIRLTDADKAKIEAIRVRFGLPSMAAAIRYAVETTTRAIEHERPAPRPPR